MAAYTSELGFLAHPVGPHVQNSEMSNQAINSLALLSARYTHTAIDTFTMLAASYIYCLCQALDLRVMQVQIHANIAAALWKLTKEHFGAIIAQRPLEELQSLIRSHVSQQLYGSVTNDSCIRFKRIAESTQAVLVTFFTTSGYVKENGESAINLSVITEWASSASSLMLTIFEETHDAIFTKCETPAYLGMAAKRIYKHVREKLQIPLNRGLVDYPSVRDECTVDTFQEHGGTIDMPRSSKLLVGDSVSRIYDSLRSGDLISTVMECLQDVTTHKD